MRKEKKINKKNVWKDLRTIVFVIIGSIIMTAQISTAQITSTPLPLLSGSDYAMPSDINDQGIVVGESRIGGTTHATYWNINANSVTDLGKYSANGINNINQAAGLVEEGTGGTAGLWNLPDQTPIKMQVPSYAGAWNINVNSIVVGLVGNPLGGQAFMWDTNYNNLVPTELVPYTGYSSSVANDINDNNQIVGMSGPDDPIATYWNASQSTITPVALNPYTGKTNSMAFSVNNYGKAVGFSYPGEIPTLWNIDTGEATALNSLTEYCVAVDINDMDQIIGSCFSPSTGSKSVLWNTTTSDPVIIPGEDDVIVRAINNLGQIVGYTENDTTSTITPTLWTIGTTYTTPSEEIQQIITDVNNLVSSGELNKGEGNSLKAKLQATNNKLDKDNKAAINELNAFINEIEALVNSGRLTSEEGQNLINAANNIISTI